MSGFWLGFWTALAGYFLLTTIATIAVQGVTHTYGRSDIAFYGVAFALALIGSNLAYLGVALI